MRKFIQDFIRKWWILVLAFSIVGSFLFYSYISRQQTYTAQIMIEYVNETAPQGLTPNGANIDIGQISSSSVIQNAIDALGLNASVEFIRNRLSVTPVIPEDELIRKEAILDEGEEYVYFPTRYIITFKVESDYSAEYARKVLDGVLDSYLNSYAATYVRVSTLPDDCSSALNAGHDYIESVEIIERSLKNMTAFTETRAEAFPNYRSSRTGYTFNALQLRYRALHIGYVNKMYAMVLDNGLTKEKTLQEEKYARRITDNEQNIVAYDRKIADLEALLATYANKSSIVAATTDAENDETRQRDLAVIEFVRDRDYAGMRTAYDELVKQNVDYKVSRGFQSLQNNFYNYIVRSLKNNSAGNTQANQEELMTLMAEVVAESNRLYQILQETVDEFNGYLAANNIAVRSSIHTYAGMNLKIYLLLAFAFFLLVGCGGGICLKLLLQALDSIVYCDRLTGLLNKAGFDRIIQRMAVRLVNADTLCVIFQLTNLNTVNQALGREYGDIMLRNLGHIARQVSKEYGELSYSGGNRFIGLFENCSTEKGQYFVQQLRDAVRHYNQQFPDYPMELDFTLNEAGETGLYEVRDLLRKTLQDMHKPVEKKEAPHEKEQ